MELTKTIIEQGVSFGTYVALLIGVIKWFAAQRQKDKEYAKDIMQSTKEQLQNQVTSLKKSLAEKDQQLILAHEKNMNDVKELIKEQQQFNEKLTEVLQETNKTMELISVEHQNDDDRLSSDMQELKQAVYSVRDKLIKLS